MKKLVTRTLAAAAAGVLAASAFTAAPADAAQQKPGKRSPAAVLAADGSRLDTNWNDFDITEQALAAVVTAKPDSLVVLLTRGDVRLTAFLPTDRAFQFLVRDLTGLAPGSEAKVLKRVLRVADVEALETILLYHVVPGVTLTSEKVLATSVLRARVFTAADATSRVNASPEAITLRDRDRNSRNPRVLPDLLDLSRGNKQIAHGIDRELRPLDL